MPICPHVYGCFHSAAQPPVVTEIIGLEKPKIFVIRVFTEKKKKLAKSFPRKRLQKRVDVWGCRRDCVGAAPGIYLAW